jgi:hypothetical protein
MDWVSFRIWSRDFFFFKSSVLSGTHSTSCLLDVGFSFLGGQTGWGMKPITHLYLVPSVGICEAALMLCWYAFIGMYKDFTFYFGSFMPCFQTHFSSS